MPGVDFIPIPNNILLGTIIRNMWGGRGNTRFCTRAIPIPRGIFLNSPGNPLWDSREAASREDPREAGN